MLNSPFSDPHHFRRVAQPVLHFLQYGFMLPASNPPFRARCALRFHCTAPAFRTPVTVQLQAFFNAGDTQHHLIVAHEVTNVGSDRDQLSSMAKQAREAMGLETLSVVADRGYFKSEQILACHDAGITAYVPKPMTSGAKADGRFNNDAFIYDAAKNEYICPAGEELIWRFWPYESHREPKPVQCLPEKTRLEPLPLHKRNGAKKQRRDERLDFKLHTLFSFSPLGHTSLPLFGDLSCKSPHRAWPVRFA